MANILQYVVVAILASAVDSASQCLGGHFSLSVDSADGFPYFVGALEQSVISMTGVNSGVTTDDVTVTVSTSGIATAVDCEAAYAQRGQSAVSSEGRSIGSSEGPSNDPSDGPSRMLGEDDGIFVDSSLGVARRLQVTVDVAYTIMADETAMTGIASNVASQTADDVLALVQRMVDDAVANNPALAALTISSATAPTSLAVIWNQGQGPLPGISYRHPGSDEWTSEGYDFEEGGAVGYGPALGSGLVIVAAAGVAACGDV